MRFSLLGFPVVVQPMFWLVGLVLSAPASLDREELARTALWLAIVFVSVLVHELGHAIAMRAYGRAPSIELVGLGGLTHWGEGPRVTPRQNMIVSLAGPFAGFVLAIPVIVARELELVPAGTLAGEAIEWAFWVNVIWGALNLLPILPLDGGHVMEVGMIRLFGEAGARNARRISIVVAGIGAVVAMRYAMPWAAFLAFMAGMRSYRELQLPLVGRDGSVPAAKQPPPVDPEVEAAIQSAWDDIRSGRARDAIAGLEARLAELPVDPPGETPEGSVAERSAPSRARLVETIAWGWLEEGEDREAVAAVRRMPRGYQPSALLAARLQVASGATEEGFRALEKAYLETPGDLAALVLAAAWIDHRAPARAVAMLRGLRGVRVSSAAHNTIAAALFYAEHYEHALEVSELAWNRSSEPVHAYNAACSCARTGRLDEGIAWLTRAVDRGLSEREQIETDDDLALLREDPRFAELVRRARAKA